MRRRGTTLRSVLRLTWRVTGWTVSFALAAVLLVAVVLPRLGGGTPYVVLTGSMRPEMPPGTLVVVRRVAATEVRVGDVITYQLRTGRPEVVTHRVVAQGVDNHGDPVFRTRGDANPAADPRWVRPVQVRGERWYAVPYVGRLVGLVSAREHRLLEVVAALGLMGYGGRLLLAARRDRAEKRDRRTRPPDAMVAGHA